MTHTVGTLLFIIFLLLVYIYKQRRSNDVSKLIKRYKSLSKHFLDYKKDLYGLTKFLSGHVDERNIKLEDSLKVIEVLVKQLQDSHDLVKHVYIDNTISLLKKSIIEHKDDRVYVDKCKKSISYLESLLVEHSEITDNILQEVQYIRETLRASNVFVKEKAVNTLLQLNDIEEEANELKNKSTLGI